MDKASGHSKSPVNCTLDLLSTQTTVYRQYKQLAEVNPSCAVHYFALRGSQAQPKGIHWWKCWHIPFLYVLQGGDFESTHTTASLLYGGLRTMICKQTTSS